jgi:hypothetical protein
MVWWGKYVLYYPGQIRIPDSEIEEVFLEFQKLEYSRRNRMAAQWSMYASSTVYTAFC